MVGERLKNGSGVETNCFGGSKWARSRHYEVKRAYRKFITLQWRRIKGQKENSFVFTWKVKKCKQKLKSFLDMKVDSKA